jgi:G3E family GTPase
MIILEAGSNFSILDARRSSQCKEDIRGSSKPKIFELSKKNLAAAGLFILNKTDLRFAPVQDFESQAARNINIVFLVFHNTLIA